MLQAINSNKAGRNISSTEVLWREIFKSSEDSLTSTIFGLLFYLPSELCWKIIRESCYEHLIPFPSKVAVREYWPSWNAFNTSNTYYVEPDIFIRTPEFDLIIEAKRYDYGQQYQTQWEDEIQAYFNEYKEEKNKLYLLAVGGIIKEETQYLAIADSIVPVVMCRWQRIVQTVKKVLHEMEQVQIKENNEDSIINILTDLLLGFRIHGYVTGEWFVNTNFNIIQPIKNESIDWLLCFPFKFETLPWQFNEIKKFTIKTKSLTLLNLINYE